MHTDADQWRSSKNTARDHRYITYSHSDSGPREYQIAGAAQGHGVALQSDITEMIKGVEYVRNNAPLLYSKVKN